jgi:hypothetical protein
MALMALSSAVTFGWLAEKQSLAEPKLNGLRNQNSEIGNQKKGRL